MGEEMTIQRMVRIAAMAVIFTICASVVFNSILSGAECNFSLFSDDDEEYQDMYCMASDTINADQVSINKAYTHTGTANDICYVSVVNANVLSDSMLDLDVMSRTEACESPQCSTPSRVQRYVDRPVNSVNVARRGRAFRPIARTGIFAVRAARLPIRAVRPAARVSAVAVRLPLRVVRPAARVAAVAVRPVARAARPVARAVRLPLLAARPVAQVARPVARVVRPVGRLFARRR